MFVVPPPPPPSSSRYANPGGLPGPTVILETNNLLSHPTDLDLVVGEGTYALRDDLLLATPPPHPTDAPAPNNNPLATTIGLPTTGTKLSIVILAPQNTPPHGVFRGHNAAARPQIASIQEETPSTRGENGHAVNGFGSSAYYNPLPATFGDGNPALLPAVPKGKRNKEEKLKPKNNIVKSNSSFVSRVTPYDTTHKRLNERSPDGLLAFANVNRAFLWLDLSSQDHKTDNLTRVLFTKAHALCHDVNPLTQLGSHLDVVMGFNTGDIIWYEPMSQKYARINKNGTTHPTPVCDIHWIPGKENLFMAAHTDGTIVVYDKEKEDAEFLASEEEAAENGSEHDHNGHSNSSNGATSKLQILKSVQSRNQKANPVAVWKLGKAKINKIAFSPDGQHLAAVSDDGTLTVMDYINERVLDVYRSYYGALLTVTWSPDGHYILTGGQDDMVSIWSFGEQALVARCVGHESWVSDVKFDPWRCDERNYRFGSVGEDCRLLLWDFSVGMLGRPKAMSVRKESLATMARLRSNSSLTQRADGTGSERQETVHPVEGKASTSVLPPVMSKLVDDHPLSWLGFEEHSILTSCVNGHVREWNRPQDGAGSGRGGSTSIGGLASAGA